MKVTKVHLAALAFVAGVLAVPATVSADGWFSRMGDPKEVTLTEVLRDPRAHLDVELKFKVYFEAAGRHYNPYYTRFNEDMYGNFSAWPIDARLYDKRDYARPYCFFFVVKDSKTWKRLKEMDRLQVLEVTAVVRDVFRGQPWFEILSYDKQGDGLRESEIRRVIAGDAHFIAGRYDEAARHYDRAVSSRLPASVRADVQRRLGDALFRAGDYGDAEDAYETGLRYDPESPVLKQGASASSAAIKREKALKKGKPVDGEMQEPSSRTEPSVADPRNGVDEVIRLLEDPSKVEAEVAAWNAELESRAAALRGPTETVTPVAGTEEPVAEPKAEETEQPAEAAAETTEPAETPVVEEEVATPETVETEGCAEQPADEPMAEEPAAEAPVAEEPAAEETVTEAPMAEEPKAEETVAEEPVVEAGEEACGEPAGEEPCGDATQQTDGEETVAAVSGEERVIWVSGQMIRLPRLPFFGCEDVTDDDLRAIIEEVLRSPEYAE